MSRWTIVGCAGVCAAAYLLVGCVGELDEIAPRAAHADLGVSLGDMTHATDAATGGGADMPAPHFYPDVEAFLDSQHCAQSGCHLTGGTAPTLVASATLANDQGNYLSLKTIAVTPATIADPTQSLVIVFLLDAMQQHTGSKLLTGTNDPNYILLYDWIAAGGPE